MITRVVDYGGLFWGDLRPGMELAKGDHRAFRPEGWIEAGLEKLELVLPFAERAGLTPIQLACHWNLAHPAVQCVVPTLIQEAHAEACPIEAKRVELAPHARRAGASPPRTSRRSARSATTPAAWRSRAPARNTRARSAPTAGRSTRASPRRAAAGASTPSVTSPARRPPPEPHGLRLMERKWWTLVGTCSGLFLLMLDSTVVSLALPSIRHDVDASSAGLQWIMNGYLLVITVLVVTAGRLGDMFGRKRLFQVAWPSSRSARRSRGRRGMS